MKKLFLLSATLALAMVFALVALPATAQIPQAPDSALIMSVGGPMVAPVTGEVKATGVSVPADEVTGLGTTTNGATTLTVEAKKEVTTPMQTPTTDGLIKKAANRRFIS